VANPDERRAHLGDEFLHHLEDFGLDRHVERSGRFVSDHELRPVQERDCDRHALAHAAGELVGILDHLVLGVDDLDLAQRLDGPAADLRVRHLLVRTDGHADLVDDLDHRVQGHHRVLEDHRDFLAPYLAQLPFVQSDQFAPVEPDGAARLDASVRVQQPDQRETRDRLARAGFAHETHYLPALQREGNAVHGLDGALVRLEIGPEVSDFQKMGHLRNLGLSWSRIWSPTRLIAMMRMISATPG